MMDSDKEIVGEGMVTLTREPSAADLNPPFECSACGQTAQDAGYTVWGPGENDRAECVLETCLSCARLYAKAHARQVLDMVDEQRKIELVALGLEGFVRAD